MSTLNVRTDTTEELSDAELIKLCEAVYGSPVTSDKVRRIVLPWSRTATGWERQDLLGNVRASYKAGGPSRSETDEILSARGYIVCTPVKETTKETTTLCVPGCQTAGCKNPADHGPCPYKSEIKGIDEPCACCTSCREDCARDI